MLDTDSTQPEDIRDILDSFSSVMSLEAIIRIVLFGIQVLF